MATKVATPRKVARKPQAEALPDTPDPIEIAMVAAASGKPIPHVARRVLEEQAELIHAQRLELRLRNVGEIVRAALWAILAVAALTILVLFGTVIFRAARSDALVVESFRVPPAMAQQGLTGDVVATQVLDRIAEFQQKTQSARAPSSYDNNWGDDLKIDIPNTGATVEQMWKLVRSWLGKETRISGEVVDTKSGIALTARVGSSPGQRFVSNDGDLDTLVTKAAELVFGQTQPYRYAVYLLRTHREPEGRALLQTLSTDPSAQERKWALGALGWDLGNQGKLREATAMYRQSLAVDPKMLNALLNDANAEQALGHWQTASDLLARYLPLRAGTEYDPVSSAASRCGAQGNLSVMLSDPDMSEASGECLKTAPPGAGSPPLAHVYAQLLRHDLAPVTSFSEPDVAGVTPVERDEVTAEMRLYGQMGRGGSPALAKALEDFRTAATAQLTLPDAGPFYRGELATYYRPIEAEALLKLGRTSEAAAIIAKTPLDCYPCLRLRGLAAEAQGDLPQAQRWFVEAVKQGPGLPQAYLDWGRLLIRARHFDGAIVKFSAAAKISPNWADPLKYWGDALAGQGKRDEALAKYDAALKLAPKWQDLREARARLAG